MGRARDQDPSRGGLPEPSAPEAPRRAGAARDDPPKGGSGHGAPPQGELPGWVTSLAGSRLGIGLLSALESTIVPIPFEAILVPLMVSHPGRSWAIALAAWLGSVVGATLFYFLGLWLYDPVVAPALAALGLEASFEAVRARLEEGSSLFLAVLLISISPAPMQLATLGAGAVGGSLPVFIAAIAVSRGLRYFGLALLARRLGERLERMRVRRLWVLLGTLAVLGVGWALYQSLT